MSSLSCHSIKQTQSVVRSFLRPSIMSVGQRRRRRQRLECGGIHYRRRLSTRRPARHRGFLARERGGGGGVMYGSQVVTLARGDAGLTMRW